MPRNRRLCPSPIIVVAFAVLIELSAITIYLHKQLDKSDILPKQESRSNVPASDTKKYFLSSDQCRSLKSHEDGNWQHVKYYGNESSSEIPMGAFMPVEVEWLRGNHTAAVMSCDFETPQGLMFISPLGNQCGCQGHGFQPTHSVWRHSETNEQVSSNGVKSSVRLVNNLARRGQNLCFMGDSIDLQFYMALQNNLKRYSLLKAQHQIHQTNISVESTKIPVIYTNETGYSLYGGGGFKHMDYIDRTLVTIDGFDTSISYIKQYGWSPLLTSFMDDCSVVIANLGLHYNEKSGELHNPLNIQMLNTLAGDFKGAVSWLLDFASSNDRTAVWRSALPQHFDTHDGHYAKSKSCLLQPRKSSNISETVIQDYNKLYNAEFAKFCPNQSSECGEYEHICTANRTDIDIGSLYREYLRANCCQKRLERLRSLNPLVTGRILRWSIADLFDVPVWHAKKLDCSHFCYIPSLYDEAFYRLDLLLS